MMAQDDVLSQMLQESRRMREGTNLGRQGNSPNVSPPLFDFAFGFWPTMQVAHWLGYRGIGATAVDMVTDLPNMVGPSLVTGLAKNLAAKGVIEGAVQSGKDLAQMAREAKAGVAGSAVVQAFRTKTYSQAFKNFLKDGPTKATPADDIEKLFDQAAKAVTGNPSFPNREGIRGIHDDYIADTQWADFSNKTLKDRLKNYFKKTASPADEAERAAMGEMQARKSAEFGIKPPAAAPAAKQELLYDLANRPEKYLDIPKEEQLLGMPYGPELLRPEWRGRITGQDLQIVNAYRAQAYPISTYLFEQGLTKSIVEEYVPRLVAKVNDEKALPEIIDQITKKAAAGGTQELRAKSRHFLSRTIPGYDELLQAEKEGRIVLNKDFSEVIPQMYRSVAKAAAEHRALQRLVQHQVLDESGLAVPAITTDLSELPDAIRARYKATEQPVAQAVGRQLDVLSSKGLTRQAFARMHKAFDQMGEALASGSSAKQFSETNKAREEISSLLGMMANEAQKGSRVYVHESLGNALPNLWKRGLTRRPLHELTTGEKFVKGLMVANGIAKRASLFLSAFHFVGLTESAIADLGVDFLRHPIKAVQFGISEIHRASDITELAIRSGLQVGPILDTEREVVDYGMKKAADWLTQNKLTKYTGLGQAMSGLRTGMEWWERMLWDYYHNGQKLFAFSEIMHDAQTRFASQPYHKIAESVAQHVNLAFGGINWERFWFSPTGRDWARLAMFAPDWTLSNALTAADVFSQAFASEKGRKLFGPLLADDVRQFYARQYAWRARSYLGVLSNFANYAFTSWKDGAGKGHWMDDNEPTARGRIEMPWNGPGGKRQYYRLGKHFNEMTDMLEVWRYQGGPLGFLRRKASSLADLGLTLTTRFDSLGRPIYTTKDGPVHAMGKIFGYGLDSFLPFNVRAFGLIALEKSGLLQYKRKQPSAISEMISGLGFPIGQAPQEREFKKKASDELTELYEKWLRGSLRGKLPVMEGD